jgi:hypothetical protein
MMILFILLQSDLLRFFIGNDDLDNWEDTAYSWLITAVVVSVLFVGATFGYKYFRKYIATHHEKKIWSRGQTWLSFFVCLFPLFLTLLSIWYTTLDYHDVIGVSGLFKGTLLAWLIYLFLMIAGHLVSPWRRELI